MNRSEVPSSEVGERVLKGVPQPVKLYRVLQDPADDRYWRLLAGGGVAVGAARRRRRRTLLWVAAAVLLAAASAGVALLLAGWDPALSGARKLAAEGRHADAVDALTRAYEKKVPPPEALELLEDCGTRAVEKLMAAKDFATARELASRWSDRCSQLRELPVKVALTEGEHLVATGQAGDAAAPLEAAAKKYDSWRLHTALSRLYAREDVWIKGSGNRMMRGWYYQAVDEIRKAVALAPAGKPMPEELKAELWARFVRQPPTGSSAIAWNAGELCKLVAEHLWPEYREKLMAGAGSREHALRVNSLTVLKITGAEDKADLIAHHAWNMSYGYWAEKRKEAAGYLTKIQAPEDRKRALGLLATVRAELEKSTSYSAKRAIKELDEVVAALKAAG
ncbi:MAG: hypothetical protein ACYTGB_01280 [Planctomycetota bacterium]|jgi:hypothetical protein